METEMVMLKMEMPKMQMIMGQPIMRPARPLSPVRTEMVHPAIAFSQDNRSGRQPILPAIHLKKGQ
jgi:hypothetical protein